MKPAIAALLTACCLCSAKAAPITVHFAFDAIASGSFTYDSSLDGGVIGLADLDTFSLQFAGLTTSHYGLAFLQSPNINPLYFYMGFDSANDSFLTQPVAGLQTTLSAVSTVAAEGFFARHDLQMVRDYAGGGLQFYRTLNVTVDRGQTVPEPSALGLTAMALFASAFLRRRRA